MEQVMGIGSAAVKLGVHPGSLRRAEREGRVPRARREPVSRTRFYTPDDIERLRGLLRGRSHTKAGDVPCA